MLDLPGRGAKDVQLLVVTARARCKVGPWNDAIPSVTLTGYAVPIRRAD
jgi:hypothetical protein